MKQHERLFQLGLLCKLNSWTKDQLWREVTTRYPKGITPNGPPWKRELVDQFHDAIMKESE